jgi:hypothetical protein
MAVARAAEGRRRVVFCGVQQVVFMGRKGFYLHHGLDNIKRLVVGPYFWTIFSWQN